MESVSVWFRSKTTPRNGILGFGRAKKWSESSCFTCAIFARSLTFAPRSLLIHTETHATQASEQSNYCISVISRRKFPQLIIRHKIVITLTEFITNEACQEAGWRLCTWRLLAEHLRAMSTLKSRYQIWILYIRLLLFTIPTTRDRRTSNWCSLKHRTRVAYSREPKYKKTNINALSCPRKGWVFPQDLFWGSFTSHNSGNYLRHGINITTNQRLSPTFRGNGNTIIVGDSPFFWCVSVFL